MAMGDLLRQARQEMGLSQRQLCGEEITRNMLSQIENGAARPSMDTLRYLARRLEKPVSYFLEEQADPAAAALEEARRAYGAGSWEQALEHLQAAGDTPEGQLLFCLCTLDRAEAAIAAGKKPYAAKLLQQLQCRGLYLPEALEKRRLLLLSQADPRKTVPAAEQLPSEDASLLLWAAAAQEQGQWERSISLLEAAQNRRAARWLLLRGEASFALDRYREAAEYFLLVEAQALERLEQCYQRLGDYEKAYAYAVRRRN